MVLLHAPGHPAGQIGVDKDLQTFWPIPQHIVAAPPHNNTRAFVGQLPDHVGLGEKGLVADGHTLVGKGGGPDPDGGDGQMEAAAGPLLRTGNKVRGQAALLRCLLDDGPVIAWDAQLGSQALANQSASTAKFAADGNDVIPQRAPPDPKDMIPNRQVSNKFSFVVKYIIADKPKNDNGKLGRTLKQL